MARITDTDSDDLVLACGQAKDGGGKTIGVSAYDGECFGTHLFSQLSEMLGFSSSFFSTLLLRGLIRTFCNCDGDEPNCW